MSKEVTGQLKVNLLYRFYQDDNISILEDVGKIDYELNYVSGTGIAAGTNAVWYAEKEHSGAGIDSLDLGNLPTTKLNLGLTETFLGSSSDGKILGFRIFNKSPNNLYYQTPFFNDTDYCAIPPSGKVTFGTTDGWNITSGDLINISGNGSLQRYDIALIGAGVPLVINADNEIPWENVSDVEFNSKENIEFTKSLNINGRANIEWTTQNDVDFDEILNLEFQGESSVDVNERVLIEFNNNLVINSKVNLEFDQDEEILPKNRAFHTSYNNSELDGVNFSGDAQPYNYWQVNFRVTPYGGVAGPVQYNEVLIGDHALGTNTTRLPNIRDAVYRQPMGGDDLDLIYMPAYGVSFNVYQQMNVNSGSTYKLTADLFKGWSDEYDDWSGLGAGIYGTIYFYDGFTGDIIDSLVINQAWFGSTAEGDSQELDWDIVAPSTFLILAFGGKDGGVNEVQGLQNTTDFSVYWDETSFADQDDAENKTIANRFIIRNLLLTEQ